jgi:sugar lactone lactonase YvrE
VGATAALLVGTLATGAAAGGGVGWAIRGGQPVATTPPPPVPPAWQPRALPLGTITSLFGDGGLGFSGDGGPATFAEFDSIGGVAFDLKRGDIYIADYTNQRVRRVDRDGIITTVAGDGIDGFTGDGGPATSAQLDHPTGVAVADDGSLYIADSGNDRIRRVDTHGVITTVVGTGKRGGYNDPVDPAGLTFAGDGVPATQAMLRSPNSVAFDAQGNLYIADEKNQRIRRVGKDGIITTVAGSGVEGGGDGDGPATDAFFKYPYGLAFGPDGSLYVTDQGNDRIRRITPQGRISTIAGTGVRGYSGDGGPATQAQIDATDTGTVVDAQGDVYFSDNARVRRIDTHGIITTVVGTGELGHSGDGGPAVAAQVAEVAGMALDEKQGILYLFDTVRGRMRAVRVAEPPCTAPPCPSASASRTAGPSASPSTPAVTSTALPPTPPVAARS